MMLQYALLKINVAIYVFHPPRGGFFSNKILWKREDF